MSILYMNAAWDAQCESPMGKLVLLSLADNANDQGVCWPSIATIAERCSCSERTVQNQIIELTSAGLLKIIKRTNKSNVFSLLLSVHRELPTRRGEGDAPVGVNAVHPRGAAGAPTVVQDVHQGGAAGAPRSIIDPSIDPSTNSKESPIEVPEELNTPEFLAQWERWMRYRRKLKKHPNFSLLFNGQLKKLLEFPPEMAIRMLARSEEAGYTGLVFDSDRVRLEAMKRASSGGFAPAAPVPMDIATLSKMRVADMTDEQRRAFMRHATS